MKPEDLSLYTAGKIRMLIMLGSIRNTLVGSVSPGLDAPRVAGSFSNLPSGAR